MPTPRSTQKKNTAQLKELAQGQYDDLIAQLVPDLAEALQNPTKGIPCPCHGSTDGFNLGRQFNETGLGWCQLTGSKDIFAILEMFNGWDFKEALKKVSDCLGGIQVSPGVRKKGKTKPPDKKSSAPFIESIWSRTIKDNGTLSRYFKSRCLSMPVPPSLRLHPSLKYFEPDKGGKSHCTGEYPAMIAKVFSRGPKARMMGKNVSFGKKTFFEKMVGIHITYLNPDGTGKANVPIPRKMLSCSNFFSGGVIVLYEHNYWPGTPLMVGEGIETCLAAYCLTGRPVFCAMTAGNLQRVKLPDFIEKVEILADKDLSLAGQKAAQELMVLLRGKDFDKFVTIRTPPMEIPPGSKSVDWNDYLISRMQEVANNG